MDNHIPQINGDLLRMRREELGWAVVDLATRACLSKKQVKQIEEGGTSSFYSDTVKMTAAKKIGGILGLPEQSVFVVDEPEVLPEELVSQYDSLSPTSDELIAEHADSAGQKPVVEVAASSGLDTPNSNASPVSPVSPVSQVDIASPAVKPYLKSPSLETTVIQKSTNSALDSEDKPKSKNSLWFIIALFVGALGLAAVMQKPATPPTPAEPPPPILVLPPEPADPAASAAGSAPTGAAPVAPVASPAQAASSAASIPSATPGTAPVSALPASRPSVVYPSPSSAPSAAPAPAGSVAPAATASQAASAAPSASKPQ
jgi:transcriptional regulator with XRE-family HTH domain